MQRPRPDLDALLANHGEALRGLCARLDPDPEDAYGSICERLLTRLATFDPTKGTLRAWAMTIAHRALVDRHRRRRRVVPLTGQERSNLRSTEQIVEIRAEVARVEAALERLPLEQRRVVVMHHLHGHPLSEIADGEGIAVGTVKSRLHRGRAQLAVWLREDR